VVQGLSESELEDLYNVAIYKDLLLNKYRVSLDSPKFHSKRKWSDRIRECFRHCGKPWDDRVEMEVKIAVAQSVAANPGIALNEHHRGSFDSLVQSLESRLEENEQQEA
jgi:hypothetical protein